MIGAKIYILMTQPYITYLYEEISNSRSGKKIGGKGQGRILTFKRTASIS